MSDASAAIAHFTHAQKAVKFNGGPALIDDFELPQLRAAMQNARLFLMAPEFLIQVYEAGQMRLEGREPYVAEIPDRLPFESVYLDSGEPVRLMSGTAMVGWIFSLRGGVFRAWFLSHDAQGLPSFNALYTAGIWQGEDQLGSLVVPQLVSAINHQPPVATPLSTTLRYQWQKQAKGTGSYPKPYYEIRTPVFTSSGPGLTPAGPTRERATPNYRYDSRAHQRLLCYRGEQPLDERDRKSLLTRGYEVFSGEVPEAWAEAMEHRGHEPLKPSEWVALRFVNVRESIKGASHLPYVPSVRS